MKLLFVNLSSLRFNVTTPETAPLGGTESAQCYVARELAIKGHDVTLVAQLPEGENPAIIRGVKHFPPAVLTNSDFLAAQQFDAIIVANQVIAGPPLRELSPRSRILFWNHLAPNHPSVSELKQALVRDSFDGFIYVSNWQLQVTEATFGFNKASAVIGNGFAPAFENMFASPAELQSAKENRAAYTTTPFRGLNVLLDAMTNSGTGTRLDLYSSMKVYQTGDDDQYAPLYRFAAQNPLITQHGAVAQSELAKNLRPVAFFTYPSTYPETFCIAALEAVAAGMKVLTTATAALPEVLGNYADYVPVVLDDMARLPTDFRAMIERNVAAFKADPTAWAEERFAALQHVNRTCTWRERAKAWEHVLSS